VTDSVTSNGLGLFIKSLGGKHFRYRRGYKNVIGKGVQLNEEGVDCQLMMETRYPPPPPRFSSTSRARLPHSLLVPTRGEPVSFIGSEPLSLLTHKCFTVTKVTMGTNPGRAEMDLANRHITEQMNEAL